MQLHGTLLTAWFAGLCAEALLATSERVALLGDAFLVTARLVTVFVAPRTDFGQAA